MFSSLWIKMTLTLLLVALIFMASCRMMKMMGCNARKPRPPVSRQYEVVSVISGVEIECKRVGSKGRKTFTVTLADIDSSKWPEESRKHLEELAGKIIRVEQPRRGLFRSTPDDAYESRQDGEAAEEEVLPEADGAEAHGPEKVIVCPKCGGMGVASNLEEMACPLCSGTGCDTCDKLGKLRLDWFTVVRCQLWMSQHIDFDRCKDCTDDLLCRVAFARIKTIIESRDDKIKEETVECPMCNGWGQLILVSEEVVTGLPEARGPIVGDVYGGNGALLNLAQVTDGYATCLPSADKTWKAEERKAIKANRGMWWESRP